MTGLQIVLRYTDAMWRGLQVTLKLCAIIWTVGIVGGSILGAAGSKWPRTIGIPSKMASVVLAAIPALVFLFWLHYPAQELLGIVVDPFITASTALSIINTVLVADLCRGVLNDFPRQYTWAANVCGLSAADTIWRIKLPIVLRQIIPGLLLIQISMLQATLFASLISVDELFRVAQRINSQTYRPVAIYSLLAMFFILVCVPLHLLAQYLRTRFTRDTSER